MVRGARPWIAGAAAVAALLAVAAASAPAATPDDLARAKATAAAAFRRAAALEARADATIEPEARALLQSRALAARVTGAEAQIAAAEARRGVVAALLADQQARLAQREGPVGELLAAMLALTRRPAELAILQPGSIADLVHARAVLAAVLPAMQQRSAALRAELQRTRALQASASLAARSLADGRTRLVDAREALAAAGTGGERALSLAEEAREIVGQLQAVGDGQQVADALLALPGPPVPAAAPRERPAYRLPAAGRLVTGFGELSADGVRARGLTLAVAPGAAVMAPAGGTVIYAKPFRSYGGTVIIDHGAGWKTLVTGLARLSVAGGDRVAAGGALGRAPATGRGGAAPQVMVELRRAGRALDVAQLIG